MPLVSQRKMAIAQASEGSHSVAEVEVYQLANNARIMLYGEHKRSKKRLKAAAVDVPKSTTGTST